MQLWLRLDNVGGDRWVVRIIRQFMYVHKGSVANLAVLSLDLESF